MSTESLITNIEYNTKMDTNINLSLNSNEGTILPEDLSYAITINTSNDISSSNSYLILKINILICMCIIIILCYYLT
jgi:hypothetical protein